MFQVEDSEEIEPELFYLDYKNIESIKVDKKYICLSPIIPVHPCIERLFSESQDSVSSCVFILDYN